MSEHASTVQVQDLPVQSILDPFHDRNQDITGTLDPPQDVISDTVSKKYEDDALSFVSETSTVVYMQEPYSLFQNKVIQLNSDLFPCSSAQNIIIERMKGGSFNRIIGITLLKPGAKLPWYSMAKLRSMLSACMRGKTAHALTSKQLVLRIPRDDVHDLYYQAAALSYLELKLPYSVPKSISFDSSANNALGRAYMLLNRIPGHSLSHIWPKLTHEQRKSAARCISEVVRDLHKVKNTCAGVISPRNTIHDLETDLIKIEPVSMPGSTVVCKRPRCLHCCARIAPNYTRLSPVSHLAPTH
jgi:hypothetical protein